MATIATFILGAVVGGGTKWAYDAWRDAKRPPVSLTVMREKSAEQAANVRQFAVTNLSNIRAKSAEHATNLRQSTTSGLQTVRAKSVAGASSARNRLTNLRGGKPETAETVSEEPASASALESVKGIGPIYASVLANAGITTLQQLAAQSVDSLTMILDAAGHKRPANVESWPAQAAEQAKE